MDNREMMIKMFSSGHGQIYNIPKERRAEYLEDFVNYMGPKRDILRLIPQRTDVLRNQFVCRFCEEIRMNNRQNSFNYNRGSNY